MKKIRIVSAVLAVLLAFSALSLPVFAADIVDITAYPTTKYESQRAKLEAMAETNNGKPMYVDEAAGYALYFDTQSAEFALENLKTGEIIFSNPYDLAVDSKSTGGKGENDALIHALLSQVILQYQDKLTGASSVMKSYTDAALPGGQIVFKTIAGGVRVEYAIGTVEPKRLVPQWIEKDSLQKQIFDVLGSHTSEMTSAERQLYAGLISESSAYYKLVGPAPEGSVYDPKSVPSPDRPESYEYLVNNEGAQMYVLLDIGERRKKQVESMIKKYCPDYTFDKLEEDHEITGYEGDEKEPPLFRLAIEYTIDEHGLTASIPAKSIRYNETNYILESIALLPYFGCTTLKTSGTVTGDGEITRTGGYIFIPDGSGTLLYYYNSDGTPKNGMQGSSMYGFDYAYENISATDAHAETYRIPVFGLTEYYDLTTSEDRGMMRPVVGSKMVTTSYKRGFVAIIEEGDAFATIRANLQDMGWAGSSGSTEYSTVYALFNAKQTDQVVVGSSIGGENANMSKTIDIKYVGNYTIRYTMLSDPEIAKSKGIDYYDPSYVGMAEAYRDYLIRSGSIDKLLASEIESSLPLYIHSFGSLKAQDTFLSFPVKVEKPLTTFDDVITMSEELKTAGIVNVKFILEGFANGGMSKPLYPNYVKWSSTVGGTKGLKRLLDYTSTSSVEIFPEFDFANVAFKKTGSGFSYKKYAVQSMSGRYTLLREYNPVTQILFENGFKNVVSSGAFMTLFNRFAKYYDKYEIGSISAMTLGTELNSDFNEDYPITREESKVNTEEILAAMKEKYGKVLVNGGNAYSLPYATDVVGIPLDNSGYQLSSCSVPFIGMVLHGYMNYAGSTINTAGDIKYEVLKSLENGAALYFLLSYQNTSEIKNAIDMGLSSNYSVAYQTWKDDVITYYNMLNDAVKSLQTATITDHSFVTAYRLDGQEAALMFAQYNETLAAYESAKKAYYDVMEEVDALRNSQKETEATLLIYGNPNNPSDPINERCEIALRDKYNAASERYKLAQSFILKYKMDGVVSVTYTDDNGKDTVFFINYNRYNVAIEYDGGVYILGAESFVKAEDITSTSKISVSYEAVTALTPTAGQLKNYLSAQENYDAALASGNQTQITRAKNALDRAISMITRPPTTNVVKLTSSNGNVGYYNYTSDNVMYQLSDGSYIVIAAQSYVIQ